MHTRRAGANRWAASAAGAQPSLSKRRRSSGWRCMVWYIAESVVGGVVVTAAGRVSSRLARLPHPAGHRHRHSAARAHRHGRRARVRLAPTAMTTVQFDVISDLAGVQPASPLAELRAQRPEATTHAQGSYDALFAAPVGSLPLPER